MFVMIGAEPNTSGSTAASRSTRKASSAPARAPAGDALASPFATTRPGIFAVGDVRSGSVKRVASGVGEGSVVVQAIHRFLNPVA